MAKKESAHQKIEAFVQELIAGGIQKKAPAKRRTGSDAKKNNGGKKA